MRNLGGIVALLSLSVVAGVGCEGAGKDEQLEFKKTDTAQFKDMQDSMINNMKKPPGQRNKAEPAPKAEEPAK